jgi:cytochrome c biogenesis protein CcdA
MRGASHGRQQGVKDLSGGVKDSSGGVEPVVSRCILPALRSVLWTARSSEGNTLMADLAYALLLIGVFALLALTVRGLEKL